MDALSTHYRRLSEIRLWEGNPKRHDVERLMGSIRRYGFVSPLIVNEATGVLLAGHGRYLALKKMKERGEAPPERIRVEEGEWLVPVVTGVSLEALEAMSYALEDNLSTMSGGDLSFVEVSRAFNDEKLAHILGELAAESALPEFGNKEEYRTLVEAMLEAGTEALDDQFDLQAAMEERPEPRIRRGEVWQLGLHRLMNGDSTSEEDVAKLMGDELAALVVTDPPYGIGLDPDRWGRGKYLPIENDDLSGEELLAFLTAAFTNAARHTREDASWYVWHAASTRPIFVEALARAGIRVHQEIVWIKESFQLGWADYQWQHEACLYAWGRRHRFYGERNQSTVWQVAREKEGNHPTAKPVELFARPLRNNLRRGELILDMFAGSGTAIVAAEALGRQCYAMELDPVYCEVAMWRWELMTGEEARRLYDADGVRAKSRQT